MSAIHPTHLPPAALLARYAESGAYTDCYFTDVPRAVTHAAYVEAFYTGALFRVERLILRLALGRPSTDEQVRALALGQAGEFAAWWVEDRAADQLLLCDIAGRTRSWLMVAPLEGGHTRLYFGSAVVPKLDRRTGQRSMGFLFRALLGFHKLYSWALLSAARGRVMR